MFYLTDWFILYFFIQNSSANKIRKNGKEIIFNGLICDRKSQLSGILTNPLNPRAFDIENRIYREELKESLGMNFLSPFQPEREFKVYKSCKCSQIICSRVH